MINGLCADTRESTHATEIFIAAVPRLGQPIEAEARRIFMAIHDELTARSACLFQERIFATETVMGQLRDVRAQCYGQIEDGVPPSYLVCTPSRLGDFAGVQVHAISGPRTEVVCDSDGRPHGRRVRAAASHYLGLSAISAPQAGSAEQQARAMFEQAQRILSSHGASFQAVPRTWLWLRDINGWYSGFNRVRNTFFSECGILGRTISPPMPASTGIGLNLSGGADCGMDLTAVLEPPHTIEYHQAGGKQRSAFEYGSAFSRASRAVTPAGRTVFISGTASIDRRGQTIYVGDASRQIETTLDNVLAVLADMKCRAEDVVQALAYSKTLEVEALFETAKVRLDWPWISMICDVCRPDLLFEIEVTAMPRR